MFLSAKQRDTIQPVEQKTTWKKTMTQTAAAAETEPAKNVEAATKDTVPADWEASILAFACHNCAFAAADLAGVMRLSYSPNVKIIRLSCTGKLGHSYVLRAFERGIDGVFVAG